MAILITLSARSSGACAGAEQLSRTQRPRSGIGAAIPLIVAGFLIEFVVIGGGVDTVSVFLNALATANGWPRGTLSAGIGVGVVFAGFATPLVGLLIDRFGVRVPDRDRGGAACSRASARSPR